MLHTYILFIQKYAVQVILDTLHVFAWAKDVFLIQTAGRREWKVGTKLMPVGEEYKRLIPGLDVRVLDEPKSEDDADFEMVKLILEAGDVLYLPPRIPHWGTALTNGCATFSVGCRAPSGAELVARLAEKLSFATAGMAVKRFEDADLFDDEHRERYRKGEITAHSKKKAKQLIKSTLEELLNDEDKFDEWFGGIITEPKRVRSGYPIPLDADDEDPESLWDDPALAVKEFINGAGFLHQAEGITFAYSTSSNVSRLFANGECWEVSKSVPVDTIANNKQISRDDFTEARFKEDTVQLLESLVTRGLLYGADT
mmetsp:Transcript_11460/g.17279  ORF Transcript_11460/g.17279 Transcript_11460/m.17279 type:complete len:313 (+) Transcript_11460:708-1646(+)